MKQNLKKLLIFAAGVLCACLLAEVCLQITDHTAYDSIVVDYNTGLTTYNPNSTFEFSSACFDNTVHINHLGFHAKEVATQKPAGVFRIVLLGDSYTEALQVPIEQSMAYVLEQKLNAQPNKKYTYEVVPLAFAGDGTYNNLMYLSAYGAALQPDLVIDAVMGGAMVGEVTASNVVGRIQPNGDVSVATSATTPTFMQKLLKLGRKSKLLMNLNRVYTVFKNAAGPKWDALQEKIHPAPTTSTTTQAQLSGLQVETNLFAKMKSVARGAGAKLVVLTYLNQATYIPNQPITEENLEGQVSHIAGALQLPYSDFKPAFEASSSTDPEPRAFTCDGHFNAHGHEVAAGLIAQYLIQNRLLTK